MRAEPARRPRRRAAAVIAVLFLLIGVGLLLYSFVWWQERTEHVSAAPIPTTSLSPTTQIVPQTQTVAATVSPGGTVGAPPVVVVTTYVPVPILGDAPSSVSQDSGVLALITAISGLFASLAGILSAVVSMRAPRSR
jgi:hypothetical protein